MPSLLIVGSNQLYTLENSYERAFRQSGWDVCFWHPAEALSQVVPGGSLGRLFSQFINVEPWQRRANETLLRLCLKERPDLLFVISTTGVQAGTLAQIRAQLPQIVIYSLFPDSPQLLFSERHLALPFFDRLITSSPAWVDAFKRMGARQVSYLPFAADTTLLQPAAPSPAHKELVSDVQFIGNWRLERETLLSQLTDYNLKIWGGDYWRTRTQPDSGVRQHWGKRQLVGAEFAQGCAHSKISLNIMDAVSWPGPNMRVFELPACGAFALTERSEPVLELFHEGETIECFSGAAEARDKIDYYLRHNDARERIARAAYEFVTQAGHTYRDRVKKLLSWWEEDKQRHVF